MSIPSGSDSPGLAPFPSGFTLGVASLHEQASTEIPQRLPRSLSLSLSREYRQKVFTKPIEESLKNICWAIGQHYEIIFVEIGSDEDHVHFLLQSVPMLSPTKIARTIKSITARELFDRHPEIRQILWSGSFWTSGFYINTVGRAGNEETIRNYVKNQGGVYKQLHREQLEQQALFS